MAKARAIQQHLVPLSPCEERKPRRRSRALESIEPVAVNARIASENCRQFLPAHTLNRIAPDAFHLTNDAHELHLPLFVLLAVAIQAVSANAPRLSQARSTRPARAHSR